MKGIVTLGVSLESQTTNLPLAETNNNNNNNNKNTKEKGILKAVWDSYIYIYLFILGGGGGKIDTPPKTKMTQWLLELFEASALPVQATSMTFLAQISPFLRPFPDIMNNLVSVLRVVPSFVL